MNHLLEVKDLKTYFRIKAGEVKAVDGVSFTISKGESLGLVGESGCGKTTTALSVIKLLPDNGYIADGQIIFDGKDITHAKDEDLYDFRWTEMSMIFQGAMNALNPVQKVSDQIMEALFLHYPHITKEEALAKVEQLFELVEIDPKLMHGYPHEFSGGMRQRAIIAMALSCDPKLVIGDEPTTALDVMVQAQIINLINDLRTKLQMSLLMITHDLSIITEVCDRIAVMYAGKIVELGSTQEVVTHFLHPYTEKLIGAFPNIYKERKMVDSIPGDPPDLFDPPPGCRFAPRCTECIQGLCDEVEPELLEVRPAHYVACHRRKADHE
ncbi:MAG: ABC transporter ATP-binding protein [Tissierellia bacterium]|jgi:peptide/nickel transport system ATP-binding protein|nr:ABC transporter ATP-binding protein [Bacillota bacterium]NLL23407.1 ABC transporter ATP-binding protein [Tissierellia bacterium]